MQLSEPQRLTHRVRPLPGGVLRRLTRRVWSPGFVQILHQSQLCQFPLHQRLLALSSRRPSRRLVPPRLRSPRRGSLSIQTFLLRLLHPLSMPLLALRRVPSQHNSRWPAPSGAGGRLPLSATQTNAFTFRFPKMSHYIAPITPDTSTEREHPPLWRLHPAFTPAWPAVHPADRRPR